MASAVGRDPQSVRNFVRATRAVVKLWHRSEVRGLQHLPEGGFLLVSTRPTSKRNVIDFAGRTGYVKTALRAGVPIVPMVAIGGQENQLILTRGEDLARWLALRDAARVTAVPISFGFPFGPALGLVAPLNVPLPTKIVTQVLPPVDIRAEFGEHPDPKVVDAHVRALMQSALDELARRRRFPIIGQHVICRPARSAVDLPRRCPSV